MPSLKQFIKKLTDNCTVILKTINTSLLPHWVNSEELLKELRKYYIASKITIRTTHKSTTDMVNYKEEVCTSVGYKLSLIPTLFKRPIKKSTLKARIESTFGYSDHIYKLLCEMRGVEIAEKIKLKEEGAYNALCAMLDNWTPIVVYSSCRLTDSRILARIVEMTPVNIKLNLIGNEYSTHTELYDKSDYVIVSKSIFFEQIN